MDILCGIDPIYQDKMVTEGNQKVLYVHITQNARTQHKLTKALLSYGFELNPYDLCVANKMVNSEQLMIC